MTWFKSLDSVDLFLIVLFLVFYGLYIFRMYRIARRLQSGYKSVFVKLFLRTIYFSLLIVALMGPSFGESKKEVKTIGKDIFIAVDLSKSMDARDIQPSRLEKVKFELKNIVDAFHSDRIGLIIFSSEAFMQCPLTYDQSALNLFIETLNTGLVPSSGTDFGPPIKMALSKFSQGEDSPARQKSQLMILISDGEDFGEESEGMAREANDKGIKVFTLGVGTAEGSKIPAEGGVLRDRSGNPVITKLNDAELKTIADITDAQYFEINETNNGVSRLINRMKSIEGEVRGTREIDVTTNKYFYFLSLAFCLMVLDVLVSLKTIRI